MLSARACTVLATLTAVMVTMAGCPQEKPAVKATTRPARAGGGWSAEQVGNAATIAAVGRQMNVPRYGRQIALAAAMQESTLHNLPGGPDDSAGLFQQRPSQGWGRYSQVRDPRYAARRFYAALLRVGGWQRRSVASAAQAVQRSCCPDAYSKWGGPAGRLLTQVEHG